MKTFFSHPVVSLILKLGVSLSLLAGLIYYIDLRSVIISLSNAKLSYVIVGFLLVAANTGIHFLRWRYLLRLISKDIPNSAVFISLLVGLAAGFFTPGQVGEFAGRIASQPDLRKSHVVGVSLIDKLYLLALTLITGISAFAIFFATYMPTYWNPWYGILAVISVIFVVTIFLNPQSAKMILTFVPKKIREHRLYNIIDVIEHRFHNSQGRTLFFLTAALYTVVFVQYYIFAIAFEHVSFLDSLMCSSSVYFVKAVIVPISIGDLGVRESAAIFFFSKVGVSAASAFNASLCMFLANIVLPSAAGSLLVLKVKLK